MFLLRASVVHGVSLMFFLLDLNEITLIIFCLHLRWTENIPTMKRKMEITSINVAPINNCHSCHIYFSRQQEPGGLCGRVCHHLPSWHLWWPDTRKLLFHSWEVQLPCTSSYESKIMLRFHGQSQATVKPGFYTPTQSKDTQTHYFSSKGKMKELNRSRVSLYKKDFSSNIPICNLLIYVSRVNHMYPYFTWK